MMVMTEVPSWAEHLFPEHPIGFINRGDFSYTLIDRRNMDRLMVICSATVYGDGKRWMHVSCSTPSRLPTWDELRLVKDTFIGRDRVALQVLPRAAEHVNIHPYVLHLWSCLDGDVTPDFRIAGQI
jgi:hypothetical protein